MHVKSPETMELTVSLTSSDGLQILASAVMRLASSLSFEHHDECVLLLPIGVRIALLQSVRLIKLDKIGPDFGC
jgi:hypothetical protein